MIRNSVTWQDYVNMRIEDKLKFWIDRPFEKEGFMHESWISVPADGSIIRELAQEALSEIEALKVVA